MSLDCFFSSCLSHHFQWPNPKIRAPHVPTIFRPWLPCVGARHWTTSIASGIPWRRWWRTHRRRHDGLVKGTTGVLPKLMGLFCAILYITICNIYLYIVIHIYIYVCTVIYTIIYIIIYSTTNSIVSWVCLKKNGVSENATGDEAPVNKSQESLFSVRKAW